MKTIFKTVISCAIVLMLASSCGKTSEEIKPIRKDVTEIVFASGVLEANGTYYLTAQSEGYLSQVNFKEGDLVKEGSVLAVVDNKEIKFNTESTDALYNIAQSNLSFSAPALVQAKNAIAIAKQNLQQDSLQWIRYRKLIETKSVASVEYENAQLKYQTSLANYESALEGYKLQKQQAEQSLINNRAMKEVNSVMLNNNEIRALIKGKVYEKRKEKGDFVRKGDIIAMIGDADFLYAKVSVDESNISKLKLGQASIVQLNTDKEKTYKATVGEIYPAFDEASQSFYCKLIFSDKLDFKVTGTQLQSNIIVGVQKNALLIPRNYLNYDGTVQIKGEKQSTKVVTNFVSTAWVQILSGIDENVVLTTQNISANKLETSEVGASMQR
jgi:multidrug efflux pump subunit AcrA (membrane-fusion protein)